MTEAEAILFFGRRVMVRQKPADDHGAQPGFAESITCLKSDKANWMVSVRIKSQSVIISDKRILALVPLKEAP
jgi:hypothetical protein